MAWRRRGTELTGPRTSERSSWTFDPQSRYAFFLCEELLFFSEVKVNVRVRVSIRVSIRVRMRVRVRVRVRFRVRNGQFLNWSITALGVKGLCAASASTRS